MRKVNYLLLALTLLCSYRSEAQQLFSVEELMKMINMKHDEIESMAIKRGFKASGKETESWRQYLGFMLLVKSDKEGEPALKRTLQCFDFTNTGKLERRISYSTNNREEYVQLLQWIEEKQYKIVPGGDMGDSSGGATKYSNGKNSFVLRDNSRTGADDRKRVNYMIEVENSKTSQSSR